MARAFTTSSAAIQTTQAMTLKNQGFFSFSVDAGGIVASIRKVYSWLRQLKVKQQLSAELPKTKKRRRRHRPVAEPGPVLGEPKTVMQLIFESQRSQLDCRASDGIGKDGL